MKCKKLIFSGHAVQRMFERGISPDQVRALVEQGETIAEYPDDLPYPSQLILGFIGNRPIHLILGYNELDQAGIVITVYEPRLGIWQDDFKKKRRS